MYRKLSDKTIKFPIEIKKAFFLPAWPSQPPRAERGNLLALRDIR